VVFTYLTTIFYVVVCLVLLMAILLQQGKGGDIASAFGGSSSQTAFGARAGATLLTRITSGAAVLFMIGAIALGIVWQRGGSGSSVVSGKSAPVSAPARPAAPAPTTPAAPAK
jgi:preprotein translocase subunit SecG